MSSGIGLLGKKVGMTQLFDKDGKQVCVTVVEAGPCYVTGIRTKEKNGYTAVQLSFDRLKKESRMSKPKIGQFKKLNIPALKLSREFRTETISDIQLGNQIAVDTFEEGDFVDVEGVSIGRGFQGVVKRHHFKGDASKSHGSMFGRVPGSIGQSSFPSRVLKGMRAAGHMGDERVTIQNLKVIKVDRERHLIAIQGAVPGIETGYLLIRSALKRGKKDKKWKVLEGAKTAQGKKSAEESSQLPEEKS